MRGVVQAVDEPADLTHGCTHTDGEFLAKEETLEIVVDHRLFDALYALERVGEQQEGVSAKTGGQAGDGAGSTTKRSRDLPVCRAGQQAGGDGRSELGSFHVVRKRETLLGEAPAAAATDEAWDPTPIAAPIVVFVEIDAEAARITMRGTGGPGTVGRREITRVQGFDGSLGPGVHAL
jgi:hypothetical protein